MVTIAGNLMPLPRKLEGSNAAQLRGGSQGGVRERRRRRRLTGLPLDRAVGDNGSVAKQWWSIRENICFSE